jgi:polysaccharide biosynthesis protein PslG
MAVILISLMHAAAAHAAPRTFYGAIPAIDPSTSEINRMGTGRMGTLRINLYWGAVQPSGANGYDWSHYDQIVGDAAQNGIRVLPTVYGSPPWVAPRPNLPPRGGHLADFQRFVAAAARRYGHDGVFWQQHPAIPRLAIDWWQLWNEVNSPSFWSHKPNPKQYVRLLRRFHAGIKSGDPSARIVLAGLFPTPEIKHGITSDRFLRGIYRNRAKPLFDATALHPYSTTPGQALARVQDMRRTMARYGDRKAKLWLTEIGWATGGPRTALTVSPRRQAAYLRQTYRLMAHNRRRYRIPGVIWYSWRDIPGGIWFEHTGLFTAQLESKPAWHAFTRLTGGRP